MADPARPGRIQLTERWIDTAIRPDLHPPPVQRKGTGEMAEDMSSMHTSSGQVMPATVQAKMEQAFGTDFSAVRIHQGPQATRIGALAYTQGTDIHFAPGQYDPTSQRGQELLGHELTHVVQQSQGRVRPMSVQGKCLPVHEDAALELEADVLGVRAARGERIAGAGSQLEIGGNTAHVADGALQRKAVDGLQSDGAQCSPRPEQSEMPEDEEDAAELGQEALRTVGYEKLIELAMAAGLLKPQQQAVDMQPIQRQAAAATGAVTFWEALAPWATAAGVASQADTPAPGPGDLIGLGILAAGLVVAGAIVLMARPGNQADTGIMEEVYELLRTKAATNICAALVILMDAARRAGDRGKINRIKKTQKAKGCRHSRHS